MSLTMRRLALLPLAAALTLSCAGPQMNGRQTTASIARSDDPWLMAERCTPETPADPAPRIEVLAEGVGDPVVEQATIRVHYVATLPNGSALHDSHEGNMPSEIILGSTKLMCGFERGIAGMRAGEQRRIFVPWQLGFGEGGRPPEIPPRADLVFVVDLYVPAEVVIEHGSRPVNPAGGGRRR
jgi:FKBP-type peptidyl-prolyl cis-trans isomerase